MRENARIIVEGMDGSGKTTLVRKLLTGLGSDVSYLVRNDRGPNRDLGTFWIDSVNKNPPGTVAIHDRFFYPEIVYGPVLRGRISVEGGVIAYVSEFIRHFGFLIYCRPDTNTISKGIQVEEQWPGVKEHFTQLIDAYDQVMIGEMVWYYDRFFKYDWKDDEADPKLLSALTRYLS